MIGDFEFIIDDHTSKMDIRQWYELVSESGCSVEFVPKTPYPVLNSKWRHLDFGNVCINYIHNTRPLTAIHVPDLKEVRQNRNFKLVYNDSPVALTHYDRLTRIPAESFVLLENAHPFELEIENESSIGISLNLEGSWLKKYIPNPKLTVACPISAGEGWGKILLDSLKTIEDQQDPEHTIPRSLIAEQLGSLLSLAMLPSGGTKLDSRHQISLYSKLDRILHEHCHQPDLNPDVVAKRAGISRRHLFNVFARTSMSFSKTLLHIRLENARNMLLDERYKTFRVCDVAWACGFSDLSHFGRRFKEFTGSSPSEYRKQGCTEASA